MKSVCVFCGSSMGNSPLYAGAAYELGRLLAENNIRLIYGGAKVGLMGKVADGVLKQGGKVTGVLPTFLAGKEIAHASLTELILVESMHERKMKMSELADGFIALPGGMGTMEELCEILTWSQLGLHGKPAGVLNVNGYYDFLLQLFQKMVEEGFLREKHHQMLLHADKAEVLLTQMNAYQAPAVEKWLTNRDT
ncbi:TIGR00730 family Rossman fold protein [Rhodocytophaga aerolata]|uniref:Cytokinin riboside 5'-monophosphate phosphoribohydrolase n=1 Tax=Rhodocytophaga aerolata TaxID=455078 RepID=A0ABT8QYS2_9BACT|nr:TIGR00730 family Rossman fold protein [Rhodocytophaga aerolata]MDO1444989.1 TIGR00730 family Rossman fold protein [Rhodocytophaga aerolata]